MARSSAQQAVNNFTGGLVTEASPLNFPENSLGVAKNVEVEIDGTLRSRRPFNVKESMDQSLNNTENPFKIRKFHWREKNRVVVLYITESFLYFELLEKGVASKSGRFSVPTSYKLAGHENTDVSFIDNGFVFHVNVEGVSAGSKPSLSMLVRARIEGSQIKFSEFFTMQESVYQHDRDPSSGSALDYETNQEHEIFEGVVTDMNKGWFREEYYNSDGTYLCFLYLRWDAGSGEPVAGTSIYFDSTNTSGNTVDRLEFPATVDDGDYTYYLDQGSVLVTAGDGVTFPERDYAQRHTVAGVYRMKKGSYKSVSKGSQPLKYRDFSGLPNIGHMGTDSIIEDDTRILTLSAFNAYNLYNAGWKRSDGTIRLVGDEEGSTVVGAGESSVKKTKELLHVYPSISDSESEFLTEDAESKKAIGLYSPFLLARNKPYNNMARRGSNILNLYGEVDTTGFSAGLGSYFIPDYFSSYTPKLSNHFNDYIEEKSPVGQVSASAYIAGRMWYAVTGRDFNIMFSQIDYEGKDFSSTEMGNLTNCYQRRDPNSKNSPEILDTDGGTMVLKDIGTVYGFKPYKQYILVFASEGVWAISGQGDNSFRPTSYSVSKISDEGVASGESVLFTEDFLFYLTKNSLNVISANQYGILETKDVSSEKILEPMKNHLINFRESKCKGMAFDSDNKRVVISYNKSSEDFLGDPSPISSGGILGGQSVVFDLRLGSFYEWDTTQLDVVKFNGEYVLKGRGSDKIFSGLFINSVQQIADLGVIESDGGLRVLYRGVNISGGGSAPYVIDTIGTTLLHVVKQNEEASFLTDGYDINPVVGKGYFFETEAMIPYSTSGIPYSDKSVSSFSFFQDLSSESVVRKGESNPIIPKLDLNWEWDWDSSRVGESTLTSNLRYPEQVSVSDKEVGVTKTRIPGRGKSLTLTLSPSGSKPTSFKILGYFTEIDTSTKH